MASIFELYFMVQAMFCLSFRLPEACFIEDITGSTCHSTVRLWIMTPLRSQSVFLTPSWNRKEHGSAANLALISRSIHFSIACTFFLACMCIFTFCYNCKTPDLFDPTCRNKVLLLAVLEGERTISFMKYDSATIFTSRILIVSNSFFIDLSLSLSLSCPNHCQFAFVVFWRALLPQVQS